MSVCVVFCGDFFFDLVFWFLVFGLQRNCFFCFFFGAMIWFCLFG